MAWKVPKKTSQPASLEKAYDYAVFLLSLHLRTVGEIQFKLLSKGYNEQTAQSVIGRLTDNHYLDDRRYAEVFLENLKQYKTFGFYGIKKKMLEKKLPAGIIENILSENLSPEEEIKIAKRLLNRETAVGRQQVNLKTPGESRKADYRARQKLAQRLRARGFRSEVIAKLLA